MPKARMTRPILSIALASTLFALAACSSPGASSAPSASDQMMHESPSPSDEMMHESPSPSDEMMHESPSPS